MWQVEQCGESSGRQGDTCMFVVCVAACSVDTCKADPATAAASAFTIADYYEIRVSVALSGFHRFHQ